MPNTKGIKVWKCFKCGKKFRRRNLKKLNSGWFCIHCYSEKKKEHREYLKRNVLGLTKEQEERELKDEKNNYRKKERRKIRELKPKKQRVSPPKIKGSKNRVHKRNSSLFLTKLERQVLWKKYLLMGFSPELADEKIKRDMKFLSDLIEKLRKKKKSDEEISNRFKEEFAKLVMESEK